MAINLSELEAAVQCRRPPEDRFGLGWETIAAFNSWLVAENYMRDCQSVNRQLQYRCIRVSDLAA